MRTRFSGRYQNDSCVGHLGESDRARTPAGPAATCSLLLDIQAGQAWQKAAVTDKTQAACAATPEAGDMMPVDGKNDSPAAFTAIVQFVAGEVHSGCVKSARCK